MATFNHFRHEIDRAAFQAAFASAEGLRITQFNFDFPESPVVPASRVTVVPLKPNSYADVLKIANAPATEEGLRQMHLKFGLKEVTTFFFKDQLIIQSHTTTLENQTASDSAQMSVMKPMMAYFAGPPAKLAGESFFHYKTGTKSGRNGAQINVYPVKPESQSAIAALLEEVAPKLATLKDCHQVFGFFSGGNKLVMRTEYASQTALDAAKATAALIIDQVLTPHLAGEVTTYGGNVDWKFFM